MAAPVKQPKALKSWSILLITGETLTRVAPSHATTTAGFALKDADGDILWYYAAEDVIDVAPADFVFDYDRRELLATRRQMKGLQPLPAVIDKPSNVAPITSRASEPVLHRFERGEVRFNIMGVQEDVPFEERAAEAAKWRDDPRNPNRATPPVRHP